ncbi:uncharacterized protein LOC114543845 [Dendronephthya gigantea]|uniref:uncharacterized protein LOC114543845 n=1 Tax=Dendronephthya gigantea TaxID=151771 RepID=UPI00106C5D36|nr:uncharacterized protein LOC114543845 [Dendronephthya gigantea]
MLHSPRFTCDCAPGYHGRRCDQPIKSCRGYVSGSYDPPVSGHYTIVDDENQPFPVFCNFAKSADNITVSWTLIQSYKFGEKSGFRKSFFRNDRCRRLECTPYRTILQNGLKTQVDILTVSGSKCMNVDIPCGDEKGNKFGEDNFGRYQNGCVNPAHRCSMSDLSTTQA